MDDENGWWEGDFWVERSRPESGHLKPIVMAIVLILISAVAGTFIGGHWVG